METEALDIEYVRAVGEEVRARLFPRPARDGAVPYPLPVAVSYEPQEGNGKIDLLFIPARSLQYVPLGEAPEGVKTSTVLLAVDGVLRSTELEFGKEPTLVSEHPEEPLVPGAVVPLLRAVTGIL